MQALTVSAGIARGLVDYAAGKGADEHALLARAGIDAAALEDPDNRVPFERYVALSRAAQDMLNDPALSLHWGADVDMSEVSIVGLIMNASATMAEAFLQMQRYGRLAMEVEIEGDGPRFELAQRDSALWMVDRRANPNDFPELTEGAFVRLVTGPRRFLAQPHVLEVHLTRSAPSYVAEYERIFQCPVKFDADWNAMRLHPDIAGWRVALQPRYVFGVLIERADALMQSLEAAKTMRGEVEALLLPVLHTGEVSADAIADKLGFSRQTLFRKLKAEDTTYEDVLDDLRQRMAMNYLTAKKTSVNETAYLVGFSDPSAFSRAFKRWTGKSPKAFRDEGNT